jgi:CRISPR/Cas system CSM-associated protein Csm2 small subunit
MGKRSTKTQERVKEESHTIYFLYGIPENKLREVAAHELAHDWMQAYYPEITDLKTKEGWAEYIASRVNILYGRAKMNLRMKQNRDLIYGGGYRMIKRVADQEGGDALFELFENTK